MSEKAFVTYREFGAVGDGKTDDFAAIRAAHEYANEHGLPVVVSEGTYYIASEKRPASAIIRTDVDWTGASFIIDDSRLTIEDKVSYRMQTFRIPHETEGIDLTEKGITSLKMDQQKLDYAPGVDCYVNAIDREHLNFRRKGLNYSNGSPQTDCFILRADGTVDPTTPIIWDFNHFTELKAYPLSEKILTVKGGTFTHIANQAESRYTYYTTGLIINRSNVVVDGMTHYVEGEGDHGAPYDGMIQVYYAANVTIKNCLLTAHYIYVTIGAIGKPVSMGTYDIRCRSSVNVLFKDCRQTTDIMDRKYWGIFVSDYCKNLALDGCIFSRFDAHMGVTNVSIKNCTLGWQCCNLIGHGLAKIEDSTLYGFGFVSLRGDYGATWKGDLVVKNCTWLPAFNKDNYATFVNGYNECDFDYGFPCYMPQNIEIDGLFVDDRAAADAENYRGVSLLHNMNPKNKDDSYMPEYPYYVTKNVKIRNFRSASGKKWFLSYNTYMYRNVNIDEE